MNTDHVTFVYLDIAAKSDAFRRERSAADSIFMELQYSLSTLRAEIDGNASVVVYTNRKDVYEVLPVEIEDIGDLIPEIVGFHNYIYRAKPWVLLHALRKRGGTCVFLDSDTFILPGFMRSIREKTLEASIIDKVYSASGRYYYPAVNRPFPNQVLHKQKSLPTHTYNSGVIGMRSGRGESILEDTLHIIDEILPTKNWARTLEQEALSEAMWLHGEDCHAVQPWLYHYYHNSQKRYMRFQIKRLLRANALVEPSRPCIKLNKHRVKLYQYYHDTKTAYNSMMDAAQARLVSPLANTLAGRAS